MPKIHKLHFELNLKYSREAGFSSEEIRKAIEKILRDEIGDRFGAYAAVKKVEVE